MFITLLIFLAVTLGVFAGYQMLAGVLHPDAERVRRRLAHEFDPQEQAPTPSPLFKDLGELNLEAPRRADSVTAPRHQAPAVYLADLLKQAKVTWSAGQLALGAGALGLVVGLLGLWLGGPYLALPLAVLGASTPVGWIYQRVRVRRERLLRQLPGAFELMARVLRAGSSVPQALQAVADAFEEPLASEFAECQKQLDLGLRPEESYQEMALRCGIVEMRIFVMATTIQRQTGGSLAEVLERLAVLVRARLRLRQQIRTLTAEGRMQGWVLLVLPVFVFFIMLAVNREYAEVLLEHTALLTATGVAMLFGILWIRRIVNFDL